MALRQQTATSQLIAPEKVSQESSDIALQRIRQLAQWLDAAYQIPGTNYRVGWDSLIGLIPGVGDAATGLASAVIIGYAMKAGVRKRALARMLANLGIDLTVGSIPLLGDFFDATFKANLRNVAILEKELNRRSTK